MSLTNTIKAQVRGRWASPSGAALQEYVPLTSLYSGGVPAEPPLPYAALAVERDGDPEYTQAGVAGAPFIERRRLVVSAYAAGTEDDSGEDIAGAIVALILPLFSGQAWWDHATEKLLACWPDPEQQAEEQEGEDGEPVWKADVGLRLMFQRALP